MSFGAESPSNTVSWIPCPVLAYSMLDSIQDVGDRRMHQQTPPRMLTESSVSSLRLSTFSLYQSSIFL
ncbi:hypothetical protein HanIR_Chr17g0879531 [Helianthus annuus]|nr:hypothetical protein HanIR_Chr17g0879531 [Helianthus annuus]